MRGLLSPKGEPRPAFPGARVIWATHPQLRHGLALLTCHLIKSLASNGLLQ